MAKLPANDITTIFDLLRQLLEHLHEATATNFIIYEQFGETEVTRPELEQLDNVRERAKSSSSRLYTLSIRVAEFQPNATPDTLNLLYQAIEQADAINAASEATINEIKRDLDLP